MFSPSELEGEVDHSFFDSDCADRSSDAEKKAEKGLKAEKEIPAAHEKLEAKRTENDLDDLLPRTGRTRKHLKKAENNNSRRTERKERSRTPSISSVSHKSNKVSSENSDGEDYSDLHSKKPSGTFMALLDKEVVDQDVYNQGPNEIKEEALPFSSRSKSKSKSKKGNMHKQSPSDTSKRSQSPSLSSTGTSANADSEGSNSCSSQRRSLESPTLPRGSSLSSGVRKTRVESARPQDLPTLYTAESDDTVTDVTPLSSPDTSPLQSLDLNATEVEDQSLKGEQQQQQQESVPPSGLRHIHQDEDSDQNVDECSLSLESQLEPWCFSLQCPGGRTRENYSFSNNEVRRIDFENQRLLQKLSRISLGPRQGSAPVKSNSPRIWLTHSAVNRQREQQRIERENLALLKRLEAVKATPGLRRSEQLADYQRQVGYLGGPS